MVSSAWLDDYNGVGLRPSADGRLLAVNRPKPAGQLIGKRTFNVTLTCERRRRESGAATIRSYLQLARFFPQLLLSDRAIPRLELRTVTLEWLGKLGARVAVQTNSARVINHDPVPRAIRQRQPKESIAVGDAPPAARRFRRRSLPTPLEEDSWEWAAVR